MMRVDIYQKFRAGLAGSLGLVLVLFFAFYSPAIAGHFPEDKGAVSAPSGERSDTPGVFDYYLLALTWTPTFCSSPAGQRASSQQQCSSELGFVIHGLWPQYGSGGSPQNCNDKETFQLALAAPARRGALSLPPGNDRFLGHEWRKHGTCSGLEQGAYFQLIASAAQKVILPESLVSPGKALKYSVLEVKQMFSQSSPGLFPDAMEVKIDDLGNFSEVWICLDKQLNFLRCSLTSKFGSDKTALFPPVK